MSIDARKMEEVAGDIFTRDYGKPERLPTGDKKVVEVRGIVMPGPTVRNPVKTSGYNLIPPKSLGEVARVFQIGADKYERRGWEKGIAWSDIADRIFKHYGYWARGEKFDAEDGQHNLASVAWAAMVLMEFERTHPELDDIHA